MDGDSTYSVVALLLTIVFGLIGAVQLIGPRFVLEAYRRWDYGPRVRLVTGVLDVVAAIMLAVPVFRASGIALAAILTFGSVIVFLSHRQYRYAVPAIGLMIALVPAAVAVPRPAQVQFIAQRQAPMDAPTVMAANDGATATLSAEGLETSGLERQF